MGPPVPRTVVLALAAVALIAVIDYQVPAGVVVGILFVVPILLASLTDRPRWVYAVGVATLAGFAVASAFGADAVSPPETWLPNRIFITLALPAAIALSLVLQARRLQAESARDLNDLLLSLLAHDLRSPLVLAEQAMDYVTGCAARGTAPDLDLVEEAAVRVRRSLRAIDVLLTVTRADGEADPATPLPAGVGAALEEEIRAFERAAERAGKHLRFVRDGDPGDAIADVRVLRQLVSILIDNGIRYGDPGTLTVHLAAEAGAVVVRVADQGPGLTAHRQTRPRGADSSGLGIALASALAQRAGGRMELEEDGAAGTTWAIRIPRSRSGQLRPTPAPATVS